MKTPEYYGIKKYTWNNGKLDVDGNVNLWDRGLTGLPFEFGVVKGSFNCSYNKLTSLQGAPERVGGNFDCGGNKLTSLQGAPEKVGGSFHCRNNKLTSLQGAPGKVGRHFDCRHNSLTSLQGAPGKVGGYFNCDDNSLPAPQLLATLEDPLTAYSLMIKGKIKLSQIPKHIKDAWKNHLSGMDQLEIIQEYTKYGIEIPKKYQKVEPDSGDDELLNILEDLAK